MPSVVSVHDVDRDQDPTGTTVRYGPTLTLLASLFFM